MKKSLVFILVISAATVTMAQGLKVGIQFTPYFSFNRIKDQVEQFDISKNGTGFRFNAGPVIDWFLMDNVALSSGLWFSNKRSGFGVAPLDEGGSNVTTEYTLHYLQIPVGIKMFVNEIGGVWRPYVHVASTLEIKMSEKFGDEISEAFEAAKDQGFAKFYDLGLFVAIGTEMKVFGSNSVFGAITYQRGLFNVMKGDFQKEFTEYVNDIQTDVDETSAAFQGDDELKYKNDSIGIMLGFKF